MRDTARNHSRLHARRRDDRDQNLDTLDHDPGQMAGVKNNLRKALRSKYSVEDPVTIKHFGFIDRPSEVLIR